MTGEKKKTTLKFDFTLASKWIIKKRRMHLPMTVRISHLQRNDCPSSNDGPLENNTAFLTNIMWDHKS